MSWSSAVTGEFQNEVYCILSVSVLCAAELKTITTYFHVPLTQLCAHNRTEPEGCLIVTRSVHDNEHEMLLRSRVDMPFSTNVFWQFLYGCN